METFVPDISQDTWRATFVEYYTANAPTKISMVTDKMMEKWSGKYEKLMANLVKKYGPLGSPIEHPLGATLKTSSPAYKQSSTELSSQFVTLISNATPLILPRNTDINVVESKASNSDNGLETSTFTVCARVRPLLGQELIAGGECFVAVVPGQRTDENSIHTEELLLHKPKTSIMGKARLESTSHLFDYVFDEKSSNKDIYDLACAPLVKKAMNGQVGVIFAYGQTGSGKTHTMSGILDILSSSGIFSDLTDVSFSYLEMLGSKIKDCLPIRDETAPGKENEDIQIGEGLNGAILIRNIAIHTVNNADQLGVLIKRANATRATAMTSKNDTSSRSHGVAILKVKNKKTAVEGLLHVIDLAGSESSKDSKDHNKERMKETKEINSSLMVVKECIRARTKAAGVGKNEIHVPYRRNKLTLLMKDIFDIGCARLCSTVVIATCSPLASDIDHTSGTIKYAAPLRVSIVTSDRKKNFELDVHDPALWSNSQVISWVEEFSCGKIDANLFVNSLTGVQFCALSENEFHAKAESQLGDKEGVLEIAKNLYLGIWTLIVDAKTRKRRPDGSIITLEQEEEERRQLEIAKIEKARVWAEREKHMKSDF